MVGKLFSSRRGKLITFPPRYVVHVPITGYPGTVKIVVSPGLINAAGKRDNADLLPIE